jgi:hypothetical protein
MSEGAAVVHDGAGELGLRQLSGSAERRQALAQDTSLLSYR